MPPYTCIHTLRTYNAEPVDIGAMCMPGAVDKVQRLIDDAVAKGARVLLGGRPGAATGAASTVPSTTTVAANGCTSNSSNSRAQAQTTGTPPASPARLTRRAAAIAAAGDAAAAPASPHGMGQFYPPTVITDVTRDMHIYYEEVFGPVCHCGIA